MRLSKLFTKTSNETPSDEQSVSAQLLERAGYIHKEAAGVYSLLPLGLRVINNIAHIIRQEMNMIGGEEILMSGLVPKANLEKSGRWETFDSLFKLKGADEKEYALGATHEEIVVPLAKKFISSYKDLPVALYQIQDKFRNEVRAKSGVLRTREFLMKDLYSFHADENDLNEYYDKAKKAYWKVFERCGIKDRTYLTLASGGSFAKYSHEFQTETDAGEDEIYVCKACKMAINKEILGNHSGDSPRMAGTVPNFECPECKGKEYESKKCIEVGNIFKLGTKYSEPFELNFTDEKGEQKTVVMGCYGIGLQRLMGAIVEIHHDDKGIVWPIEVTPYDYHLIAVSSQQSAVSDFADKIYEDFKKAGAEVLYDDREVSAGEKFADADLLGIQYRLVVSEITCRGQSPNEGDSPRVELKKRGSEKTELLALEEICARLAAK